MRGATCRIEGSIIVRILPFARFDSWYTDFNLDRWMVGQSGLILDLYNTSMGTALLPCVPLHTSYTSSRVPSGA